MAVTINAPKHENIPALRRLWQQAFGDTDAFLNDFFRLAFSPNRSRCLWVEGQLAAMLYWFDCECGGQKIAYLYAVATDRAFQNRGLCRTLMEDTHRLLLSSGYHCAMLVPGSESLFRFYEKLGYRTATCIREFTCQAGKEPVPLRQISREEYAQVRRQMLPQGGVVQENGALSLLEAQSGFYAGDGLLLIAGQDDGKVVCSELLGASKAAPGILAALGAEVGTFRTPGSEKPFAMYLPLTPNAKIPSYFGLALD